MSSNTPTWSWEAFYGDTWSLVLSTTLAIYDSRVGIISSRAPRQPSRAQLGTRSLSRASLGPLCFVVERKDGDQEYGTWYREVD